MCGPNNQIHIFLLKWICVVDIVFWPHVDVPECGLHLASTTRNYRKLTVGSENNAKSYDQWADRCTSKFIHLLPM